MTCDCEWFGDDRNNSEFHILSVDCGEIDSRIKVVRIVETAREYWLTFLYEEWSRSSLLSPSLDLLCVRSPFMRLFLNCLIENDGISK